MTRSNCSPITAECRSIATGRGWYRQHPTRRANQFPRVFGARNGCAASDGTTGGTGVRWNVSTTPVLVGIINPWIWLVVIQRCRGVLHPRSSGPTRSGTHDQASVRMGNGMPVGMIHRGGVGGRTQHDQQARGQNIAHRNFSNRTAMPIYVGPRSRHPSVRRHHNQSHRRHPPPMPAPLTPLRAADGRWIALSIPRVISVSIPIATMPLMRECAHRVDPAIRTRTARGSHALLIG